MRAEELAGFLYSQAPSYWEALQRALDIKGTLPNEIVPATSLGITLLDLSERQFSWLRREAGFISGRRVAAGGAGQFGGTTLENPTVGSENLAFDVVCRIQNNTGTVNQFECVNGALTPNLAVVSNRTQPLDNRQRRGTAFLAPSQCVVRDGTQALGLGVTAVQWTIGNGSVQEFGPFVVQPGTALTFQCLAANVGFDYLWFWKERVLYPGELNISQ